MKAKDIMTSQVLTIGPDLPVREIAQLMLERRVSAVPVVDEKHSVIGIVSEGDLIRRPELETDKPASRWINFLLSNEERARDFVKTHGMKARDVMTAPVISVSADTSLAEVVKLLSRRRIKRVVVLEGTTLTGIVTRTDLLRALHAHEALPTENVPADDQSLREAVLKTIAGADWAASAIVNVQVSDGTVHLWGAINTEDQRRALRVAVEGVPGVRTIEDHLGVIRAG